MEGMELTCFKIISSVGTARSLYIEAIQAAKNGQFEKARELVKEGVEKFREGHCAHAGLLTQEAAGEGVAVSMILMHSEDQLMSAEGFKMIAEEFIDVYQKMGKR